MGRIKGRGKRGREGKKGEGREMGKGKKGGEGKGWEGRECVPPLFTGIPHFLISGVAPEEGQGRPSGLHGRNCVTAASTTWLHQKSTASNALFNRGCNRGRLERREQRLVLVAHRSLTSSACPSTHARCHSRVTSF